MKTIATKSVSTPTLAEVASRINSLHHQAETSARRAVEHAVAAGKLLLQAKDACGHGHFGRWIEANCDFSQRTAQTYIQIAGYPKAQLSAHLTIQDALKALAGPNRESSATGSVSEQLRECEVVIEDALAHYSEEFPERADALRKIRDNRLYRETSGSFHEFCRETFKIDAEDADRVIELGTRLNRAIRNKPENRRRIILQHQLDIRDSFFAFVVVRMK